MSHHSVLSWDLYIGVPLETQQSVSNIANAHNSRNKKLTSQYVLVTWVVMVVTSSTKCCLPMIVLGTRLKESTCWRLTNQELRNGLWLAFGQTESRLPTNPNGCHITSSISHPQHRVLSFLLQSCLYINYIPAGPTRGRWRVSSSQSCPWWSPPARLCTRTPRCQSSKSPTLLLLLPGVKNLMSLKCEGQILDKTNFHSTNSLTGWVAPLFIWKDTS